MLAAVRDALGAGRTGGRHPAQPRDRPHSACSRAVTGAATTSRGSGASCRWRAWSAWPPWPAWKWRLCRPSPRPSRGRDRCAACARTGGPCLARRSLRGSGGRERRLLRRRSIRCCVGSGPRRVCWWPRSGGRNAGLGHDPAARPPVAIVGGGLAGLVAAHELRRRGIPVTVFEAGKQVAGLAASFRTRRGSSAISAPTSSPTGWRPHWASERIAGTCTTTERPYHRRSHLRLSVRPDAGAEVRG